MLKLLKQVHIYAPDDLGVQDLLIADGRIAHIAEYIPLPNGLGPVEVVECEGKPLLPGFIDMHIHMLGGGGEGGPATRTPEITLSEITRYGVTTAVGVLGTDGTTRSMPSLVTKAKALELEGITTYVYTGSYEVPTPTITGSVRDDVILIEKVIGVGEVAISDHRSAHPSLDELGRLAMEARVGGLLGGKPGICHFHVGPGKAGIQPIFDLLECSDAPVQTFLPTHCGRSQMLLDQAVRLAELGGQFDLTAGDKVVDQIDYVLKQGAPLTKVTITSDGNGSLPRFDAKGNFVGLGVGSVSTVYEAFVGMIKVIGLSISEALHIVSCNQARLLQLEGRKGCIAKAADADLILMNEDFSIDRVWAKGRCMVADGKPIVWGTFEHPSAHGAEALG